MSALHKITFFMIGLTFSGLSAWAAPSLTAAERVQAQLEKNFPQAKVELVSEIAWTRGEAPDEIQSVVLTSDNGRGQAGFIVRGRTADNILTDAEGSVEFTAHRPAWIAIKRVMPGERLSAELLTLGSINVATGMAREFRGVILGKESKIEQLEAKQTILEGAFALSSGVQKIPDVRRGDAIQIKLLSGEVVLSTSGTADEPAYYDGQLHVTTTKTKRALIGKLRRDGIVEVTL